MHSRHLHAPLRGRFGPNSVNVARYASLIGTKSPTKCDAHLTESNFQTHPRARNGRKMGHRLHSRRNPEGFLRSSRLKSCFGEHDFSPFSARPGLKGLRSSPDCSKPAPPSPPSDAGAFWLREK
ncbi:DUF6783 domain-containing protein [Enterocloster lavalensis]|uniref:DUF6783 domain-containing protein n=1 Tax=Enterocloster lavalensis TaxID=460384 RepID=UPI0027E0ED9D|nr:DUF6783 domain-containing protein [Enterocloster lavalensis]